MAPGTTPYSTNNMNQYSHAGSFSYTYDADGNLTGKTNGTESWSYSYDAANRLIASSGPDEDKEYIYNGLGQLATVITDGVEYHYVVDPVGFGNVVGEYDTNGDQTVHYTHGLGLLAKGTDFYTFDGNGNTSELTSDNAEIRNYLTTILSLSASSVSARWGMT